MKMALFLVNFLSGGVLVLSLLLSHYPLTIDCYFVLCFYPISLDESPTDSTTRNRSHDFDHQL